MSRDVETTKVTVELPTELYNDMHKRIPWGMRKHLIASVLDVVLKAIATDGNIVMGAIMAGQFKLVWTNPTEDAQNLSGGSGNAVSS